MARLQSRALEPQAPKISHASLVLTACRMALRCLGPWTALEAAAGAVLAPSAAELRAMFDAAAKAAAS